MFYEAVDDRVAERKELDLLALQRVGLAPRLLFGKQEDLAQVALDLSENRVEPADCLLEQPDPSREDVEDALLDRAPRREVEDLDRVLLTDAVDATDALLHLHRV